jgi:ribonuclease P protein component
VGKAVARNRARRLLRIGFLENREEFEKGYDLVFVARKEILGKKSQEVATELRKVIRDKNL